jgi:glycerol kinase
MAEKKEVPDEKAVGFKAADVEETVTVADEDEGTTASTIELTDHWLVSVAEVNGLRMLSISQPGWVGPAPVTVPASYTKELIAALTKLVK